MWSSGILWVAQYIFPHLQSYPNNPTFFLQLEHLLWEGVFDGEGEALDDGLYETILDDNVYYLGAGGVVTFDDGLILLYSFVYSTGGGEVDLLINSMS